MKTGKILITLWVAASIIAASSAYADLSTDWAVDSQSWQTSVTWQNPPPPPPSWSWVQNQKNTRWDILKAYLKTDLTSDEMAALKAILDAQCEKRQVLEWWSTASWVTDNKEAKDALDTQFIIDITPYIVPEKLEEFKVAFTRPEKGPNNANEKWPKGPKDQKGPKGPKNDVNWNNEKPWIIAQAKLLPNSIGNVIDTKIATFKTTEEKIAWLNKISAKVSAAIEKAKWEKAKAMFTELNDLIKTKIDEINWVTDTSTDDSIIDSVIGE